MAFDILDKLDTYEVFTNLLPGIFFGILFEFLFHIKIPSGVISSGVPADGVIGALGAIAIYYFLGVLIGGISSIVTQPTLLMLKFVTYASHSDFITAEKNDEKVRILIEKSDFYCSLLTAVLLIFSMKLVIVVKEHWTPISEQWMWFVLMLVFFVLLFTYQLQNSLLQNRIKIANKTPIEEIVSQKNPPHLVGWSKIISKKRFTHRRKNKN